jgi:hypothetical protein
MMAIKDDLVDRLINKEALHTPLTIVQDLI